MQELTAALKSNVRVHWSSKLFLNVFCVILYNLYHIYPDKSFAYNVSPSTIIHVSQIYNQYDSALCTMESSLEMYEVIILFLFFLLILRLTCRKRKTIMEILKDSESWFLTVCRNPYCLCHPIETYLKDTCVSNMPFLGPGDFCSLGKQE